MTPIETQGRQIGGMGYRISPLEGLAKLMQGYVAGQSERQTDQARQALAQKQSAALLQMLGDTPQQPQALPVGGGTPTPQGAPQLPLGVTSQQLDQGGFPQPGVSKPAAPQAPAGPPASPGTPFTLSALLRGAAISTMGGEPAAAAYWKMQTPTDEVRTLDATGQDRAKWGQASLAKLLREGNAPTRLGPNFYADAQGNTHFIPTTIPGSASLPDPSNPTGWRIASIPGGQEAIEGQEGAKARGEAQGKVEMVRMADGRMVPVPLASLLRGGAPGTPSQASPTPAAPGPANVAAALRSGPADPWATMPTLAKPSGVGQSTIDEKMAEHAAANASELSQKLGTAAEASNQRIALNNQALALLDKSDTGFGAAKIADVKNLLVSRFGVPEQFFANTPDASKELQKYLVQAATQKAKEQFGARITQSEVQLMLSQGSPNVDMPKAAIKFLLETDNAQSNYQIKRANDFGTFMQKGGDPNRFEAWYARTFPLTKDFAATHPAAPAKAPPQPAAPAPARTVVRTGKLNGRTVHQYSDGTVDYAP